MNRLKRVVRKKEEVYQMDCAKTEMISHSLPSRNFYHDKRYPLIQMIHDVKIASLMLYKVEFSSQAALQNHLRTMDRHCFGTIPTESIEQ